LLHIHKDHPNSHLQIESPPNEVHRLQVQVRGPLLLYVHTHTHTHTQTQTHTHTHTYRCSFHRSHAADEVFFPSLIMQSLVQNNCYLSIPPRASHTPRS